MKHKALIFWGIGIAVVLWFFFSSSSSATSSSGYTANTTSGDTQDASVYGLDLNDFDLNAL